MRFFKMAVAINQNHGFRPSNRSQRCSLQSFSHFDYNINELNQTNLTHSFKQAFEIQHIHRSFSTPCLSLATRIEEKFDVNPRVEILGNHGAPRVRALVVEVAIAMASGVHPMPVSSGLGGAYFLCNNNGDNIAVIKPIEIEPLTSNSSKGFVQIMLNHPGSTQLVPVGGTGIREVAAYLLDHGGFAGVPPTTLVKTSHFGFHVNNDIANISPTLDKIASLHQFVDHDFDAGEMGPSRFSVASVHRIGILDVRILNLDRHAGNILVKRRDQHENYLDGTVDLVPIDHGLCLPELLGNPYFEWLHWPQALIPFSEFELKYISNLNPFEDAELLRNYFPSIRESSIRVLILCTIFLKRAVFAGLCLAHIGEMMTRKSSGAKESLSVLENLSLKAMTNMLSISNNDPDSIKNNMESRNESPIFPFDNESENTCHAIVDVSKILKRYSNLEKQSEIAKYSSTSLEDIALAPLYQTTDHDNNHGEQLKKGHGCDDGQYWKSTRYSTQNCNHEIESITLEEMSKSEWEMFLECFENLLSQVLEQLA